VTGPLAAWLLHALAVWLWHIPALFEAALNNSFVHTLQHLSFLLSAMLFWWSVLRPKTPGDQGVVLASMFTTMVHTGALGALLTLARTPWYPSYLATAAQLGVSALEDQQLGGLIMWVPAGGVYILCGLVTAARWISPLVKPRRTSGLSA
jgi:cytochrome c oxidase assembly factor CtaG